MTHTPPTETPPTRSSLMVRVRNLCDQQAWIEFLEIYEPLLLRMFASQGLQDCDGRDLCQQVLQAVARDIEQWQPDGRSASFRRWLFRIARNRVLKFLGRRRAAPRTIGGSAAQQLLAAHCDPRESLSAEFQRQYRRRLLRWAADQVRREFRESTWQAFWRTCVGGQAIGRVAADLGMSTGNVYVARSRIISRLREKVAEFDDEK